MSGLLDFFTKEAGQKRRAWLDEKDAELTGLLSYFAGPHASDAAGKAGGLLATMSDAADFQDYTDASRATMRDPNLGNLAALATAGTALMIPGVSARMAEGAVDFGQDLARFGREEDGAVDIPLIAQHNTSQRGLEHNADLGGMPYPSIAIARADAPLENFGDVTLIGNQGMATPSRNNRVFPGDGYTVRQPRGELEIADEKSFERAFADDPRFAGKRGTTWWMDAYDNIERADEVFKRVEVAIARGEIDPKNYDSMDDLMDAGRRKVPYMTPEEEASVQGLQQFGGFRRVLPQGFTPSGNRRKAKPYTLDNVMKEMRPAARDAGGEGYNYGPNSFRAQSSQPFRKFSDVDRARNMLRPRDEIEGLLEAFTNDYYSTLDGVKKAAGDDWRASDSAAAYMNDFASGNTSEWRGVDWVQGITPEARQGISDLRDAARNLPVGYFEAKPQRAMNLWEFGGAVIPQDADRAAQILQDNGVDRIIRYGNPEDRKAAIASFKDLLFALPPAALVGMGLTEEELNREYQ